MPPAALAPHRMRRSPTSVDVVIGGTHTLVIEPSDGRVRIGMVLPGINHLVEVSAHPAAATSAVQASAAANGVTGEDAGARARAALDGAVATACAWQAPADAPLVAALGGAALPVLGEAYGAGAGPLGEIPRWAVPILVGPSARAAAVTAFGTKATRPVVAALARSLQASNSDPVDVVTLAIALMGIRVLEPDHLARVLTAGPTLGAHRTPPSREQIRAARPVIERWGARRASRILIEAVQHPHGLAILADTVRHARTLGDHGPRRLPNHLMEIHDAHRVLVRTDPGPPPRQSDDDQPTPPARVSAEPARPDPLPDMRDSAFHAPAGLPDVGASDRLSIPPAIVGLDETAIGDLCIVVPRTVADLVRWSRLLRNCLGDFGPAAVAGRSTMLGVQRSGTIRYAIELSPPTVIHQFLGPANRPPSHSDRTAVVRLLAERGVLDREEPANRRWIIDL